MAHFVGPNLLVYIWCMARTNIDIDDAACERVMREYGLRTKREAVNLGLRSLAAEPMCLNEAHTSEGAGQIVGRGDAHAVRLEQLQAVIGLSESEIIGLGLDLVEKQLEQRCRDRLDDLLASPFIGCLQNAPEDLAEGHRRYLDETFGEPSGAG